MAVAALRKRALPPGGATPLRSQLRSRLLHGGAGPPSYCLGAVSHFAVAKESRAAARASEDAYFFSDDAIGVADGVGAWRARGVDAGAYAQGLCEGAATALREAAEEDRLHCLVRALRRPAS